MTEQPDLFPTTQTWMIVNHVKKGLPLTVAEALTTYGIYALSQRVGEINRGNFGIKIKSEMVKSNGKRFAEYTLDTRR